MHIDTFLAQWRAAISKTLTESLLLNESTIAEQFSDKGTWRKSQPQCLEMMAALGHARVVGAGRYGASR